MSEHNNPNKQLIVTGLTIHFDNNPDVHLDITKVQLIDVATGKSLFTPPKVETEATPVPDETPDGPTQVHHLDGETTETLQKGLQARGIISEDTELAPELYRNGNWTGVKAKTGTSSINLPKPPVDQKTIDDIQEAADNNTGDNTDATSR